LTQWNAYGCDPAVRRLRHRTAIHVKGDNTMLELDDRPTNATSSAPSAAGRRRVLSVRVERVLFVRCAAGDRRARDELIERWLPLARSVARRYQRAGEPLDDLVQVASLALVKAIDRYDPALGNAFSSYAVPTIGGELKRHFRDRGWVVRPPRGLQELALRVEGAATRLTARLDRAPTIRELAIATESNDEQILEALQICSGRNALSLQAAIGDADEQTALQDILGTHDDGYAQAEMHAFLDDLMTGLPRRSREILRLRFEEDLTQHEIGELFGVSQMQISRVVRQAISQLRHIADHHERVGAQRTNTACALA
jgi:RNA polymerase sigma-B factor